MLLGKRYRSLVEIHRILGGISTAVPATSEADEAISRPHLLATGEGRDFSRDDGRKEHLANQESDSWDSSLL